MKRQLIRFVAMLAIGATQVAFTQNLAPQQTNELIAAQVRAQVLANPANAAQIVAAAVVRNPRLAAQIASAAAAAVPAQATAVAFAAVSATPGQAMQVASALTSAEHRFP